MCFQCIRFLPREAGEMRVCVQCTELPTPVSSSHATLVTEDPGLLAFYVLSEVGSSPSPAILTVVSFQRRKCQSSAQRCALLCLRKAKYCPVESDELSSSSVKN